MICGLRAEALNLALFPPRQMTIGSKGQSLGHQLRSKLQPGTVQSAEFHTSASERSSGPPSGGINENVRKLRHNLAAAPIHTAQKPGHSLRPRAARLQAHAVQQLHERVAELQSALEKQQRRADLLEQELSHLRASGGSPFEHGRGSPFSWQQTQHRTLKEHAANGRTMMR